MMKTMRTIVSMTFILAAASGVVFADNRAELKNIPLEWRPTEKITARDAIDISSFMKTTFLVSPFTDAREKQEEIGRNIERRGVDHDRPVTTKENVAAWLTYRFSQVLSELGLDVVKGNGACRIEGEIRKFFVTESSTYKADVGMKIRLLSKSGAVLWEGMVSGAASRFGASYKAENYHEALSDAVMTAITGLLKNEEFRQAVKKNI